MLNLKNKNDLEMFSIGYGYSKDEFPEYSEYKNTLSKNVLNELKVEDFFNKGFKSVSYGMINQ